MNRQEVKLRRASPEYARQLRHTVPLRTLRVRVAQLIIVIIFFQAEDGIRDCLLSRGLGDVYKRQDYKGIPQISSSHP